MSAEGELIYHFIRWLKKIDRKLGKRTSIVFGKSRKPKAGMMLLGIVLFLIRTLSDNPNTLIDIAL